MSTLTDQLRDHFIACVNSGRFDGERLDELLRQVESIEYRAVMGRVSLTDRAMRAEYEGAADGR